MGARLSPEANNEVPREVLSFHGDATGTQVHLDDQRSTAHRLSTFHDGIVFSHRPVWPGERVALRVLRQEDGWCGGLRVGFTRLDPGHVAASCLPPFVCPDLEEQSPTWAALLPEGFVRAGNVVCFWVNRRGWLYAKVNAGRPLLLRKDVQVQGAPLWAVMDVYGTTKAIELLDPKADAWIINGEAVPVSEVTPGEECVICFHNTANTRLIPCGHSHFCSSCAWHIFKDTARCPMCRWQIEEVALEPSLKTGEGS
ncbi:E3 ubiquitin-protein ligase NEURL3 isoform X2 [Mesocricetus auratus]|uniref:E3 ubiquitin-protein ligase NEURL3 isoform X2 n=1 Tax=Mesocricetus auratus TaxID=10036 RepID=A0ABM2W3Y0_MESAU|nr:E3 ubiquitin-protein ligase NEURL3 isoform X2 [Mesocricetus auratus]